MAYMKKIIVCAVVFLALTAVGAGAWVLLKPETAQIGDYRGEPIEEIGNDPAVRNYPAAAVEQNKSRLEELAQKLQENPANLDMWMAVAEFKKFFNNYNGAAAALEYAATIEPQNPLIYYNLANLYGLYLKDYPKAEENYLKAIDGGAAVAYPFLGLAEFYRDFYTAKYNLIDDVLLEGLDKGIPGDPNMILQLAYYYKSVGDNENAIKYFSKLLNSPDVSAAQKQSFREEIENLGS